MFKILIVEDEPLTSEALKRFITREIDDVHADVALNVPEAKAHIEAAQDNDEPYHVVVLDMMLPSENGLTATLDETVCGMLKRTMPHTLVAHITAFLEHEKVQNHLESFHGPSQIDLSFSLSKDEDDPEKGAYSAQLISNLKPFLYGLRIEDQLNDLFNGGGVVGYSVNRAWRKDLTDRSKTHELAALTRNISTDWDYLSEGLKTRIRDIFKVVVKDGEVMVSLF